MRGTGGIAKLLIALTIALFSISVVSGASVTASFNKTYTSVNDSTFYVNLTGLSAVTDAYVEFKYTASGGGNFDNDGGGSWSKWAGFVFNSALSEYAQYKLEISGNTWTLYNVTGNSEYSTTTVTDFWSNVNSDGSDIRLFNQSDDQLYFWIESFDYSGQTATIWVNASYGTSELKVAYGNPSATMSTYNDATQVFLAFFDKNTYTSWSSNGLTMSVSGNDVQVTGTASTDYWLYKSGSYDYTQGVIIHMKVKHGNDDNNNVAGMISATSNTGYGVGPAGVNTALYMYKKTPSWTSLSSYSTTSSDFTSYWHYELLAKTGDLKGRVWQDGSSVPSWQVTSTDNTFTSGDVGAQFYSSGVSLLAYISYITVTKNADPADVSSFQTGTFSSNVTDPKLYLNSNLAASYSGTLNETNPSSGKIAISNNWIDGNNSLYFNATSGNFDAVVSFNYTLDISEARDETFDYLKINSSFYIEDGSYNTTYSTTFTTSYNHSIRIWVNGNETSNFTTSETVSGSNKTVTIDLNLGNQSGNIDVYIYVNFVATTINVRVLNELNQTGISSITVQLLDINYNKIVQNTTDSNGNTTLSTVYWGDAYIRARDNIGIVRQIKTTIPNGGTLNVTIYFPQDNVVQVTFLVDDRTGQFSSPYITIKKYISRENLIEIHTDKVDVTKKMTAYLILSEPYQIFVTQEGETRNLGYYTPYASTTETLVISTFQINASVMAPVIYEIGRDGDVIAVEFETKSGTTYLTELWINYTNGSVAYYSNMTAQMGRFTYIGDANTTYIAHLRINNSLEDVDTIVTLFAGTKSSISVLVPKANIPTVAIEDLPSWIRTMFFGGLCVFVALMFRRSHTPIGLMLSLSLVILFTQTNILDFPMGMLTVLGIIVFLTFFELRRGS